MVGTLNNKISQYLQCVYNIYIYIYIYIYINTFFLHVVF